MKVKTSFFCTDCGYETPKWAGRCPGCGAWNTIVEAPEEPAVGKKSVTRKAGGLTGERPELLKELDTESEIRFSTGFGELDRVLGGGAVKGSIVLVSGAPGIGKSTLLLQLCGKIGQELKILYVTGEESKRQIRLRADRLGVSADGLYILSETDIHQVVSSAQETAPTVLIVDSIQTMYNPETSSGAGSVSQVKDCTMALLQLAKSTGITVFLVGHINKDGAIAGPKVLEHMVDCVLYFEGEKSMSYRILRAAKNRFGSTNEIGVFEMADEGLEEVKNPSEVLLSGRPEDCPGTCVACVIEGSRPVLAEIQALVTPSAYNVARRTSNGLNYNRAMLMLAVLEKRGGIRTGACDAYFNVIGGLELDEPAADLAACLAVASSFVDRPVGNDLAAVGEVGLTGEIRSVSSLNQRLSEIARLGFKRCVVPSHVRDEIKAPKGLKIISVKNVREAIRLVLGNGE